MSMYRVFSCVVGRGCLLWLVHFLGKTLLVFALLHSVFQGQICLLLRVFLDFLLLHFDPLWWKGHLFLMLVLEGAISSVQFSRAWPFVTPWIAARQASLSITNTRSSLRLMAIKSVMPSSHLILCRPLLLLPLIPPSIRVFSNESTLHMRWPKY